MPTFSDLTNNQDFLNDFNSRPKNERMRFLLNDLKDDDPEFTQDFKSRKPSEKFEFLRDIESHSPTKAYESLKGLQTKAAEAVGNFPQRVKEAIYNSKLPLGVKIAAKTLESTPMAKVAEFATSTLPKAAIEHPKATLTAAGATAMIPFTGGLSGAGVVPAIVGSLGIGAGAGLGNLVAQTGEQFLRSPDRQMTSGGVAKEALMTAGTTAALDLSLGAVAKMGKRAVGVVKAAFSKPNVQAAEKALETSNQAINAIESKANLSEILPKETPDVKSAGTYAAKLREEAKHAKDLSTELLQQRKKEVNSFFIDSPNLAHNSKEGGVISDSIEKLKTELERRIPGLGEEVAKNKLAREALTKETANELAKQNASKQIKGAVIKALIGGYGIYTLGGPTRVIKTILSNLGN